MARTLGGGNVGLEVQITCVPDATFKSEIDALRIADTDIAETKFVSLTWSNNYEVTSPADNAIPDGIILEYNPYRASPYYYLTVDLWSYIDQNSARHAAVRIRNIPYSGTIALQDSVIINDTGSYLYQVVDDGTSGGWGAVIGLDVPSGYVDVLF